MIIPRNVADISDNGWIGPDHPNTATKEWVMKCLTLFRIILLNL